VELEQPIFGANYIKGKVRAQPGGNFTGIAPTLRHFFIVSDPDWIRLGQWIRIRIRNPDPDSESGSRRAKMIHKNRKKVKKLHVLKRWLLSFES
jgi:hypothetical protein